MAWNRVSVIGIGLVAVLLSFAIGICAPNDEGGMVGIWQGTFDDLPLSIEFRQDGRVIMVHAGSPNIELAGYRVDLSHKPAHLDIILDGHSEAPWRTLIDFPDRNTMRTGKLEESKPRPESLGHDAMVFTRGTSHVLPRGVTTTSERDECLAQAMEGDIWFGGPNGQTMLAICEALFRYQFQRNASGQQQRAAAYFLAIDGRDAPPELLQRFEGHQPPVRAGSAFRTGEGLRFNIKSIYWIADTHVEATGGYHEGPLSSSRNTYHLRLEEGRWRVIRNKLNTISRITNPKPFHAQTHGNPADPQHPLECSS